MAKTKAKGYRGVTNCINTFYLTNWEVDKVEKTGKFVKQKDLYGLFDICCITENKLHLVQITHNTPHTHKRYLEFSNKYNVPGVSILQYVMYDKINRARGWIKFYYIKGKIIKTDYRTKSKKLLNQKKKEKKR